MSATRRKKEINPMRLSLEQIEEISSVLHENVQFYDSSGGKANGQVLAAIEDALRTHCCPEEIEP